VKIYTKKGDGGETGLIGGHRVQKSDPRISALGDIDELNAALGLCMFHAQGSECRSILDHLQWAAFSIGAEIAAPEERRKEYEATGLQHLTASMEDWIDRHTELMPELKSFVLPGGTILAAHLHLARAVCRRTERSLVALSDLRPELLVFINRASDWLFCAARYANFESEVEDVLWTGE